MLANPYINRFQPALTAEESASNYPGSYHVANIARLVTTMYQRFGNWKFILLFSLIMMQAACGGGSSNPPTESRSFRMGATPFSVSHNGSETLFADWKFNHAADRDLLSLHVDDFYGVPWDYCDASGCTGLPPAWVSKWQNLASNAAAQKQLVYLAVSPLGGRRTLAPNVLADGSTQDGWNTDIDSNGCYLFDSDASALTWQAAYIGYLKFIIDLIQPDYLSPAVEINIPFLSCPAQQSAWASWYQQVQDAIKVAYPSLIVFPTFQLEFIYGNTPETACAGMTISDCFDTRLTQALSINADRIAFSSYPATWSYNPEYNYSFPRDTFSKVAAVTNRPIWISETGWQAIPVLSSYQHTAGGSCGFAIYPVTLDIPNVGTIDVANEQAQSVYMKWLLEQADQQNVEAVIWWLNQDYLDGDAAKLCPCAPSDSASCKVLDDFYAVGGEGTELLLRAFGNMALRRYDDSPRPIYTLWRNYLDRSYR